ncbi:MAG: hypothetical protein EOP45_07550 [Sphingobacteriaceae bacterium]|nr:MAG: hypothetical protein EOP45_07550 [Sphingobacteriaceae bacterium]
MRFFTSLSILYLCNAIPSKTSSVQSSQPTIEVNQATTIPTITNDSSLRSFLEYLEEIEEADGRRESPSFFAPKQEILKLLENMQKDKEILK